MRTGVIFSVVASALFALMPAYLQWLPPIHSYVVIGQRVIWTSIIITIVLITTRQLKAALQPLSKPKNWPGLITGAVIIGMMWGLFVWAPLNGETLGIAMGFFLAPLVLVMVGLIVFKERLSPLQSIATLVAILAIICNLWNTGTFSWVALMIAVGYPSYFVMRRIQPIPVLTAFYLENLILIPLAIWACIVFGEVAHPFSYQPGMLLWLFGVALLGSLGMLFFLAASRRLPMTLFGLLGYLEPLFIFIVAVMVIGEKIRPGEGWTYLLICLAIILLALDGLKQLLQAPDAIHSN
jgi:chloramphenicol-sensitive protein RarD